MTTEDCRLLRDIASASNIDVWTVDGYMSELSRSDSILLKAVTESGKILGFIGARVIPGVEDEIDADVYNIAVADNYRRLGIGSMLLGEMLSGCFRLTVENIWLEVRKSNVSALLFYQKFGFSPVSTRKNFYSNPIEDAVMMNLSLSDYFLNIGVTMLD